MLLVILCPTLVWVHALESWTSKFQDFGNRILADSCFAARIVSTFSLQIRFASFLPLWVWVLYRHLDLQGPSCGWTLPRINVRGDFWDIIDRDPSVSKSSGFLCGHLSFFFSLLLEVYSQNSSEKIGRFPENLELQPAILWNSTGSSVGSPRSLPQIRSKLPSRGLCYL
jgi:hypothetical protein